MRLIIVGLGVQGEKRRSCAGADVVATVDPHRHSDFRDVRDVPLGCYEAACVCTPDQTKIDIISYLIANEKHVLVEKPLLANNTRLTCLEALAREKKTVCYTAYNHRFEPQIQRLKNIIDRQELGELVTLRLCYGNGTAHEVRHSSWRDRDCGVLTDLGSHLVDLVGYLASHARVEARMVSCLSRETFAPDYCVFEIEGVLTVQFEVTLLSWRNTFSIDVIGSKGTAHVSGLCKWGPSSLSVRQRVYPSGNPIEWLEIVRQPDVTWLLEYRYFRALCRTGHTDLESDIWINSIFSQLRPCSLLGTLQ